MKTPYYFRQEKDGGAIEVGVQSIEELSSVIEAAKFVVPDPAAPRLAPPPADPKLSFEGGVTTTLVVGEKPKAKKPAKRRAKKEEVPVEVKGKRKLSVSDVDALAFKLGTYLIGSGPKRRDGVRNFLEVDDDALDEVLERPWFEKDGGMWTLSSDGFAHFRSGKND